MQKIGLCLFALCCSLSIVNLSYANDYESYSSNDYAIDGEEYGDNEDYTSDDDDVIPDLTDEKVASMIKPSKAFFVGGGLGINLLSHATTSNSIYYTPYPYFDSYTNTASATAASLIMDFGYRIASNMVYSVGIRYEHLISNKLDGNILILNDSRFPYNFTTDVSTNALMLFGKIDLTRLWAVTPYVSLGLGVASNTLEDYSEAPANNATPRNVTFGSKSTYNLSYDVGVGLDYLFKKHYQLSIGYDYTSFGTVQTGSGDHNHVNNTDNTLNFGKLTANRVITEFDYIFN